MMLRRGKVAQKEIREDTRMQRNAKQESRGLRMALHRDTRWAAKSSCDLAGVEINGYA